MKERVWAALIVLLMVLFWAFALASPVFCNKQPRASYAFFCGDRKGICLGR
jgi:hypothetical protein